MVWGALLAAGVSLLGAKSSSKASSKATQQAAAANADALAFEKEQYQDWKDAFGDIQDNLSNYYMSRSPNAIAAQDLQAFEQEKERAVTKLRENFQQRGLGESGLFTGAQNQLEIASLGERARIRSEAPVRAANEKLAFLTAGLGQNPGATIAANKSNRAENAGNMATTAGAAKWQAIGDATTNVVNVIEELEN